MDEKSKKLLQGGGKNPSHAIIINHTYVSLFSKDNTTNEIGFVDFIFDLR